MKKLLVLILASVLLCGAVSCGEKEPSETQAPALTPAETEKGTKEQNPSETDAETDASVDTEAAETEAAPAEEGYLCSFDNGTDIRIGAAADSVLASLGDALNMAEAPSCIHEGMDRIYTYNGFSLTTSPDGKGTDRVYEIALTSDAVVLANGISIGSSLAEVEAAFGSDYTEQFGVLKYRLGEVSVSIVLDEDSYVTDLVIVAAEW